MSAVLETRGLSKRFGALVVADAIDFRLEQGARHALIGPNGAGKTTFVNIVTGRLAPSAGQVLLAGKDITGLSQPQRVRRGLARTFQINTLFNGLGVLENVVLALSERDGVAWRMFRPAGRYGAIIEEAYALLERLGIADNAHRTVRELAYGEQRLVEIALALALNPSVLLLDEPAAGVPESESALILETLARLPAHISIMLIEHDMDIVFRFARRITVLDQGRVVAEGSPEEIAADARVQAIYFGQKRRAAHA
ncbi:MAG: ABC transporter ATP-binding protein [Betaproteobacteria bacterium]|nr:ABC transporter ATP-binding protein [Betaproteobacteria bacterium]